VGLLRGGPPRLGRLKRRSGESRRGLLSAMISGSVAYKEYQQ
jgi:hypothetical protein